MRAPCHRAVRRRLVPGDCLGPAAGPGAAGRAGHHDEMRVAFRRIAGGDFGMREPRWTSIPQRTPAGARYRVGRVLLAGDSAHVHSPLGGQGMNTGIGDAMNLGWKLAGAVHGWAPSWLLDSYESERHPVGALVLRMTDTFNRMMVGNSRVGRAAPRLLIVSLLRVRPMRLFIGGRLTGLGIAYPPRERGAHKWVGRRMPDARAQEGGCTNCYATAGSRWCRAQAYPGAERVGARWSDRVQAVHREDADCPRWCWCAQTATSPGRRTIPLRPRSRPR